MHQSPNVRRHSTGRPGLGGAMLNTMIRKKWIMDLTFFLFSSLFTSFHSLSFFFFFFAHFPCPFPPPPPPPLCSGLMGPPDSWFNRHVFANNRPANTDHSNLHCPNISDCFHIRDESLETPRHLLFMATINYSPWYELQSRKAKLETVAHFDRDIKTERDGKRRRKGQKWIGCRVRVEERD